MKLTRCLLLAMGFLPSGWAAEWRLEVAAGAWERRDAVVIFTAPPEVRGNFVLQAAGASTSTPLQVDGDGRAVFIERALSKGARKIYTLAAAADMAEHLVAKRDGGVLQLRAAAGDAPIFHYQMEPGPVPAGTPEGFAHGAHLHPVFTPAGRVVTANHPPDHPHQRGIFFAWTKTEFGGAHPDFWNMGKSKDGALTGEVRFTALERAWGGPVQGGFVSRHRWLDHTSGAAKEVLVERWEVAATRAGRAHFVDLVSTQTVTGSVPLKLPKYHYGGLGVRGAAEWDPVDRVSMLTANGDDRKAGDSTKAKWVHLGGLLAGKPAGITVLIHPDNFRFPQALRLNPKNPQLCVAPSQDGDWEIAPGQPYVSRYRLVVADEKADAAEIARQWNDYATPPVVRMWRE